MVVGGWVELGWGEGLGVCVAKVGAGGGRSTEVSGVNELRWSLSLS